MTGQKYSQKLKSYGIILAVCVMLSAFLTILYKLLKGSIAVFTFFAILKIVIFGIGLFFLFFVELQVTNAVLKKKPGVSFQLKELIISAILTVLILICFLPVVSDYIHQSFPMMYTVSSSAFAEYDSKTAGNVGQIVNGRTISQTFVCPGYNLYSLTFKGATYARLNHGTLHIELIDEDTGETIRTSDLPAQDFVDNADFTVFMDPFKYQNLLGHKMRVDITSDDSVEGDALTLYYSREDCYDGGTLYLDGEDSGGDLVMSVAVVWNQGSQERTKIWLCLFLAIAVEAFAAFLIRRIVQKHEEKDR